MLKWSLEAKHLDLQFTWKISRGSTDKKVNYFLHVEDGDLKAFGEIAGITQKEATAQLVPTEFENIDFKQIQKPEDVAKLNVCQPLKFGIESALIHLICKKQNLKLHEYFDLKLPSPIATSFSLPIMAKEELSDFINQYDVRRFSVCKLKVNAANAVENCMELAKHYQGPIRVDANEDFQNAEDVLKFLEQIKHLPLQFLEQPMHSSKVEEYKKLKKLAPLPIIADESLQTGDISEELMEQFHGINVKLMKTGSYLLAIKQIQQAKSKGMKVMLGCMVETSLAILSACSIGQDVDWFDLDGFLFFKEDPFHLVEEKSGLLYPKNYP